MFRQKLDAAMSRNDSLLCVGLDPIPALWDDDDPNRVLELNLLIIEATRDVACAYKPNLAIYEGIYGRADGWRILEQTLDAIPEWIPKIGDAKRGDAWNCGDAYARSLWRRWEFDAATLYAYMGWDAIQPFLTDPDKAVLVLCRTSNPSARGPQDWIVSTGPAGEDRPLYLQFAALARGWNTHDNVGLVVGATYPDEIREVRRLCPDMLLLIPGVGTQGGDLEAAVAAARDNEGKGFIINVSRQIMMRALDDKEQLLPRSAAIEAVRREAERLRADINLYRSREIAPSRRRAGAPV
jgi:orotidine 5'-phosphate decarboxylase subfamily 2